MAKTHNRTGRCKNEGRFVRLPHFIMDTFAWSRLSAPAKVTWLEFARLYCPGNNGRIAMPVRKLGARLGMSKDTAGRAIQELEMYGFLVMTRGASFSGKRRAAEYRMTHEPNDLTGEPASKEFQNISKGAAYNGPALAKSVSHMKDNIGASQGQRCPSGETRHPKVVPLVRL